VYFNVMVFFFESKTCICLFGPRGLRFFFIKGGGWLGAGRAELKDRWFVSGTGLASRNNPPSVFFLVSGCFEGLDLAPVVLVFISPSFHPLVSYHDLHYFAGAVFISVLYWVGAGFEIFTPVVTG